MQRSAKNRIWILGFAALAVVLASAACGPKDPQEKVAQLRGYYSAELNGFLVLGPPAPDPFAPAAPTDLEPDEEPVEEAVDEAIEEAGTEEETEVPAEPIPDSVQLDILVKHRSPEKLPGITVDISMADAGGSEKGHWRVWLDTADVTKATVTQFTHVLEDVSYEEGDGFFVEVRHPVPAEERGDYREFSSTP